MNKTDFAGKKTLLWIGIVITAIGIVSSFSKETEPLGTLYFMMGCGAICLVLQSKIEESSCLDAIKVISIIVLVIASCVFLWNSILNNDYIIVKAICTILIGSSSSVMFITFGAKL